MLHPFRQYKNLVHRQRKRLTNKCFITHSQAAEKSQPQKVTVWDMNDFQLKSFYQVSESDLTLSFLGASLVAQTVKNPPAMLETWVRSLGWEDSLEEEMATHSRILAWKSPGQRRLVGYSPWGCKESDMTEQLTLHTLHSMIRGKLLNLFVSSFEKQV